ncbi:MAG: phosphoheptose isomerase [Candidatus Marinimicrobia bacterium]|nr:phosphoheptose isomerase [Candidatus Neomarinimicrobiota bacterium]
MQDTIIKQIKENIFINNLIIEECIDSIEVAANFMITAILSGKKILWCGNGGSAADAQHLATELMGGMSNHDRKPIPSIALTTDTSFLTAWSNDTEFESVFSRQIQGIGERDDLLVGISTSGNSGNIVAAIKQAKYKGLKTVLLTGKTGGKMSNLADVTIYVPSQNTQRIQESHIMIGQILCGLIEDNLMI